MAVANMVEDDECDSHAATTSNTEPEYAVINDTVHVSSDYDFVKCPAYSSVSNYKSS